MTGHNRAIHVIINPASGNNEPMLNIINDVFAEHDIKWEALVTHGPGDATRLARQAAESGCDLVACYGGDGTLMEVVNGLIDSDIAIGVLPGGTGNTVAAELGIPLKLADALHMLATSPARRKMDVGEINGRYFLLRAYTGIGDDHNASRELKDRLGILAYPISGLRFLKDHQPARFRLTVDDRVIEESGILCYVNNIAYSRSPRLQDWIERTFLDVQVHEGDEPESVAEPLLQSIDPTDGLLDIVLLTQDPFTLQAFKSFVMRSGDGEAQATVHFLQGKRIEIDADPPQGLWIDGEECGTTPATIRLIPGAIEVVVPEM